MQLNLILCFSEVPAKSEEPSLSETGEDDGMNDESNDGIKFNIVEGNNEICPLIYFKTI